MQGWQTMATIWPKGKVNHDLFLYGQEALAFTFGKSCKSHK